MQKFGVKQISPLGASHLRQMVCVCELNQYFLKNNQTLFLSGGLSWLVSCKSWELDSHTFLDYHFHNPKYSTSMFPLLFVSWYFVPLILKSLSFSTFPSPRLAFSGSWSFHVLANQNLHWYAIISPTALTSVSQSIKTYSSYILFLKALMGN